MIGKQAKLISKADQGRLLALVRESRYPERDTVILLLSLKAGLRATEIAHLNWEMVLDPNHRVGQTLDLHYRVAKKGSGRHVPLHPDLRIALRNLARISGLPDLSDLATPVIRSERGGGMRASSIVNWFADKYADLGLTGCSSHSGRRTFITTAARLVPKSGGSLRDVQLLAGHKSLSMTQRYIEGDTDAQRKLVALQ